MKGIITATVLAMSAALPASALTYGSIPDGASNEALGALGLSNPLSGWYGATLYLTGSGPVTIRATVLGYEAGAQNSFTFGGTTFTGGGGTLFENDIDGIAQWTALTSPGLLQFSFGTDLPGGGTVANGSNPDNDVEGINYFVSFVHDATASSGNGVYLFFNDNGAGDDDNHDDLVVRLDILGARVGVSPVPLPAAGFLLMGAVGGLAALRRRKS